MNSAVQSSPSSKGCSAHRSLRGYLAKVALVSLTIVEIFSGTAAMGVDFVGERYPITRTAELTEADVATWSFPQLRYAINEMYARHGYDFPKPELKQVFLQFDWYRQVLKPGSTAAEIEGQFGETEIANLKLLGEMRDRLTQQHGGTTGVGTNFVGEKFPMTRTGVLTGQDISQWSFAQVRYAINEMYARYGYNFPNKEIQEVFLKFQWYRDRLKPDNDSAAVEGEFSEVETANLQLLGKRRDALSSTVSTAGQVTPSLDSTVASVDAAEALPPSSNATPVDNNLSYAPPEMRAWITVRYDYESSRPPGEDGIKPPIKSSERENLSRSKVVVLPNSVDRVIEGTSAIAPVGVKVDLSCTSASDGGKLTVDIVDSDSGKSLDGFPRSFDDAIAALKRRASIGTETTDYEIQLTDAQEAALVQSAHRWVERDEGEDRGNLTVDEVELHIALESLANPH